MIFDFAQHADLTGQNRGRHKGKRDRTHLLSESRKGTSGHSQRGFRRHIAARGTSPSGCQNQITVFLITKFLERCLDKRLFIRNEFFHNLIIRKQGFCQPFFQRGNAFVLISAGRGTVGNGNQTDFCFAILHRLPPR